MLLENHERYRLLVAIYPAFAKALPTVSVASSAAGFQFLDRKILLRDNQITELRDEVKRIGITFYETGHPVCELEGELLEAAESALENILLCFEDLVDDKGQTSNCHGHIYEASYFPKLVWLQHQQGASEYVLFGTSLSVHKRAKSSARVFNNFIKTAYKHASGTVREEAFIPAQHDEQPQPIRTQTLASALRRSEAVQKLFSLLEENVCAGGEVRMGLHQGFLRLSNFDQETLDMLLSVCKGPGPWQQAYFEIYGNAVQARMSGSICAELGRSLRRRLPTKMAMNATSCESYLGSLTTPRNFIRVQPPNKSLRVILDEEDAEHEEARRQRRFRNRILKHNVKRGLSVNIAVAFFYLFASPLFQRHTWDMDSIHIVHGDASIPTQEVEPPVYLSFCLDSQQSDSTAARPHVLAEDGNPLLLALITIIMELEMERKIVLCDEDFDDRLNDLSLYYAVLRYHADLNDNIDCHFQEIVASCLDIYEKSQNMLGRQDYIEIQTNLFNKVIVPLMARYDMLRTAKQQAVVQVQGGNRAQIPADRQDLLNTEDLHKGFSRHLVTITEVDGMAHHPKVFPPNYATA